MQNSKKQILILHGWGSSKKNWENCLRFFDKNEYEIFLPDLPGFGTTPAPIKPWTVDDYAHYVEKFMAKHHLGKPICICHSFGGRITIKLAAKHPRLFSEIFLVAAAGIKHPPSLKIKLFHFISKTGKWLMEALRLQKLEAKAKKILYKAARTTDYLKTEGTMKETFQNVIEEDLSHYLNKIQSKTHVIWGAKDTYVPVEDAHVMHEKIQGSTLDIFPDGTHGLHLRMPEKLVDLIEKYLTQS